MWLATLLALSNASAAPTSEHQDADWPDYIDESDPGAVVGGEQAERGEWPDAVGIVFHEQYVGCTGTLIAPNVVITAGHCVGGISHVLIGSTDWVSDDGGELIEVKKEIEYPNSWNTFDIAVLKLKEKSTYEPRYIALDCILDEYLHDGAEVAVVGYGSTNIAGTNWNSKLNEGYTEVQDADCSENKVDGIWTGCNPNAQPAGELGAGGNGVDACFGDSGGPLYLMTPEGAFLVGVTSRAYMGVSNDAPCRDGGIYVRPDAVFDWIEEAAGRDIPVYNCNAAPEVSADPIVTVADEEGVTTVEVDDDSDGFDVEVVEEPEHGEVDVGDDGELVYVPDEGFVGEDSFVVAVTDHGHPDYERSEPISVELTVDVTVEEGDGGGPLGGCGCDAAPSPAIAGWLVGLVGLFGLRRRR